MAVRISVLSTFTPTPCGIATFSEALTIHLREAGADVGVVRMVDYIQPQFAPVVHQWISTDQSASSEAAAAMNDYDVAVIQHEYGIFGGPDGEDVLDLVDQLRVPLVTVLHTVLVDPTPNQRRVLNELCAASSALVTMTETARGRLIGGYGIDPSRVTVITHGAEDNRGDPLDIRPALGLRPTILTWGLLSQGKGIEWALRAFAQLRDITPVPEYRIVGQTHPRVLEREGEAYRDMLVGITHELDLTSIVRFDSHYLSGPALRQIVREADVILLPYDSRDQVTSGVLTEAVSRRETRTHSLLRCAGCSPRTSSPSGWPPRRETSQPHCCGRPWRTATSRWPTHFARCPADPSRDDIPAGVRPSDNSHSAHGPVRARALHGAAHPPRVLPR
jgi:glycosyltransferase involved in cell wall biosynthesis